MDDQIAAAIEIVSQFQVIHLFRPENGYVEWKFVKTPQGLPKNSTFSHIAVGPQIARAMSRLEHIDVQHENRFSKLVHGQSIAIIPEVELESGVVLRRVPVAYKTWGKLNAERTNVLIICHALSGSADVEDWWGPLIGSGKAFDTSKFFIFCGNALGSPYGTASPVTINPDTELTYGPEFPLSTIRDDVNVHKIILDDLGVRQIAIVIGGSMGGMNVLEWAFLGPQYVRSLVPMATSARHSAWCISWGEAQRQSIYADPKYLDGYYPSEDPPLSGLAAARMSALLTYRSRNSFESRFGRKTPDPSRNPYPEQAPPQSQSEEHWVIHNEGHRLRSDRPLVRSPSSVILDKLGASSLSTDKKYAQHNFSAQSYLRYQGSKFVHRFDPNCYISITRKLDTHDIARGRFCSIKEALASLTQPALVLGIESDGLFTFEEQREIAEGLPNGRLEKITSPEGHDGFLLEFDQVNRHIMGFMREMMPEIMSAESVEDTGEKLEAVKSSLFGEAEVEGITSW